MNGEAYSKALSMDFWQVSLPHAGVGDAAGIPVTRSLINILTPSRGWQGEPSLAPTHSPDPENRGLNGKCIQGSNSPSSLQMRLMALDRRQPWTGPARSPAAAARRPPPLPQPAVPPGGVDSPGRPAEPVWAARAGDAPRASRDARSRCATAGPRPPAELAARARGSAEFGKSSRSFRGGKGVGRVGVQERKTRLLRVERGRGGERLRVPLPERRVDREGWRGEDRRDARPGPAARSAWRAMAGERTRRFTRSLLRPGQAAELRHSAASAAAVVVSSRQQQRVSAARPPRLPARPRRPRGTEPGLPKSSAGPGPRASGSSPPHSLPRLCGRPRRHLREAAPPKRKDRGRVCARGTLRGTAAWAAEAQRGRGCAGGLTGREGTGMHCQSYWC